MKTLSVYFHPEAIREASAAIRWYQERSSAAARAFISELDRLIEKITVTPEMYPRSIKETHHAIFHRFPFIIVYRKVSDRIEIIAIAHGKRRPGYWKERLT